jgi:sialic acid synthase SpsE/quercetin dioxygenase-like cupin family protein
MIMLKSDKPLFVFEMANNHMGDVEHGVRIIREFREVVRGLDFRFSFKLQLRDESYIHPDHRARKDHKYIKRFTETILSRDDFSRIKDEITANGFISMCTPWDEPSVEVVQKLGFDILKVASCSFTDWPLLERIAKADMPIIASTAGATLDDIDKVVAFFSHRDKSFAIMHCVGEYPCLRNHLELNQIELFKSRYPGVPVGFSTHEDPENYDSVRIAVAKGASIFEKHVGVQTERYALNAYSATPAQAGRWLDAAADAIAMCGVSGRRKDISAKEVEDIQPLYRGVYANREILRGERVKEADVFLAMPNVPGQLVASSISKYNELTAAVDMSAGAPVMESSVRAQGLRNHVNQIRYRLKSILQEGRIVLPPRVEVEISTHYGMERFDQWGAVLVKVLNRAYSKMLIVMFPGQSYPRHFHRQKEESFHLLRGDLNVEVEGVRREMKAGELLSVLPGVRHSFQTRNGAIVEEIATTYLNGDSVYEDDSINKNANRKIELTLWSQGVED